MDPLGGIGALVGLVLLGTGKAESPVVEEDRHVPLPLPEAAGAAFHRNGVVVPAEYADGFGAVGLGRHRSSPWAQGRQRKILAGSKDQTMHPHGFHCQHPLTIIIPAWPFTRSELKLAHEGRTFGACCVCTVDGRWLFWSWCDHR